MENMENLKKRSESIDMLVNMLAETGIKQMTMMKAHRNLYNKSQKVMMNDNVIANEELAEKVENMFNQFASVLDDFIKENKLEEEK